MHKYSRIKTIGKGAFGEAVLVKSKDDGNLYVSKEIQLTGLSERDLVATQTEISVLGKVDHPNITRYVESFQEGDVLYIILEYADGGDLHHQIKRQQQAAASGGALLFPEHQIRNWFVQLCLALQHLHHHKILHRDLKARNVFLSKDNQIKLGDFGLSTVLKHTMAQAQTLCGTPYYFSPELCRNKPYNSKSDVWALGCILYEMCTLKHAFDATNMKGLMQKILKGCYPPISTCYSPELSGLIKTMLTKDEARRPSVTEVLELPFMQLSLKMLYHNCSKRSLEEEKAQQEARRRKAEELMTAVGEAIRGPLPPKAVDPKLTEAREKELRNMQNANRQDLKAFLKGPPPAEVLQKPVSPLTPASASSGTPSSGAPRRPSEILAEPVAIPHNPRSDADNYTQMKLPEKQYDTLRRQVERLTVTGGERCQAAREDDVVVDNGEAVPTQGGGAELLHAKSLRGILEKELGAGTLQKAYDVLQNVSEQDNDKEVMQKINNILGAKAEFADAIARLAALEAAQ